VILVDTTPLVALSDPRDRLHRQALGDLDRLARRPLAVCSAVLTEACFLLAHPVQRERLRRLLVELPVRPVAVPDEAPVWEDAFRWMRRYAEHEPDWADAYLAALSGRERRARVWTYDSEFRTTWRRLDGGRVPMAVR
jgi:predicted nucleic acid-binding protein